LFSQENFARIFSFAILSKSKSPQLKHRHHLFINSLTFAATSFLFLSLTTSAWGVPFASQIEVSQKTVVAGEQTEITYFLNESADSVLIELADGITTAAAFSGTVAQGKNHVIWNGHVDNAGGAVAAAGAWRVYVSAFKTRGQWEEIASQSSLANIGPAGALHQEMFDGFQPNSCVFIVDQDSSYFGKAVTNIANENKSLWGAALLNSDLTNASTSSPLESLFFIPPPAINKSTKYCGMTIDPDNNERVFIASQGGTTFNLFSGDLKTSVVSSADPGQALTLIRAVAIANEGGQKYAYFLPSNTYIIKAKLDPVTNQVVGSARNLITLGPSSSYYNAGLTLDQNGNLYFLGKYSDSSKGTGGILLRWDRSVIEGDPANYPLNITHQAASWMVTVPANIVNLCGPAITPNGDVYVASINAGDKTKDIGIYYVGNAAEANVSGALSTDDRVVDFKQIGTPATQWEGDKKYFQIVSDPAGNLLALDRATEQMRLFAPPVTSAQTTRAPQSQTLVITAGVNNWLRY